MKNMISEINEILQEKADKFKYYTFLLNQLSGLRPFDLFVLIDLSYRIKSLSTLYANGDVNDDFFDEHLSEIKNFIKKEYPKIKFKINTDPRAMGLGVYFNDIDKVYYLY